MDSISQEMFDKIVTKEINALTASDISFLNARESYLSSSQRETFASVLEGAEDKKKSKKGE